MGGSHGQVAFFNNKLVSRCFAHINGVLFASMILSTRLCLTRISTGSSSKKVTVRQHRRSSSARTMQTVERTPTLRSPARQTTCLRASWTARSRCSRVVARTQICLKKMRHKSCSTSTWRTKRLSQKNRWKRTKMKRMASRRSEKDPTRCYSTSIRFAKLTHCCFSSLSIASPRCSRTSSSSSCCRSSS